MFCKAEVFRCKIIYCYKNLLSFEQKKNSHKDTKALSLGLFFVALWLCGTEIKV